MPVTYVSVYVDTVVEQLSRDCHVKYVASFLSRLVIESKVERNVELAEDIVELVVNLGGIGVKYGGVVDNA